MFFVPAQINCEPYPNSDIIGESARFTSPAEPVDMSPCRRLPQENYILLLKELSEALRPRGLLLSAAVSAGRQTIEPAYNLDEMVKSVARCDSGESTRSQIGMCSRS